MIHEVEKVATVLDVPWMKIEVLYDGTYLIRSWQLSEDRIPKISEIRLLHEDAETLASELRKHLEKNPPNYEKGSQRESKEASEEIKRRLDWKEFFQSA